MNTAPEATLVLRLAAPIQAWDAHTYGGTPSDGRQAPTPPGSPLRVAPTHSGLIGMLAAALGRPRGSDTSDLQRLTVTIRIDQPGRVGREFWTRGHSSAGSGRGRTLRTGIWAEDAIYLACIGGPRDLLESIAHALTAPAYPLYLGKRSCPATPPLLLGLTDTDPLTVAQSHEWIAAPWYQNAAGHQPELPIHHAHPGRRHAANTITPAGDSPAKRDTDWFAAVDEPDAHAGSWRSE